MKIDSKLHGYSLQLERFHLFEVNTNYSVARYPRRLLKTSLILQPYLMATSGALEDNDKA